MNTKNKAVFLDRDGVINKLVLRKDKLQAPYSLEEFELCSGVEEACAALKKASYILIVVTNQPDVARGWTTEQSVHDVNNRILELLPIDHIEICFHTNEHACDCRKPLPGMLINSGIKWNIDMEKSFMVGDRYGDISAGKAAGCKTFLVGPGDSQGTHPLPDYKVESLAEGAEIILNILNQ